VVAFSLANLCFINIWYLAGQIPSPSLSYYRKTPPDGTLVLATLCVVLLLAGFFWLGWRMVKRANNALVHRFATAFFLLVRSYPVAKLIQYLSPPPDHFSYAGAIASVCAEIIIFWGLMLVLLFENYSIARLARSTAEEVFIPFTIGGGIRSVEDAQAVLDAGADKVSVNSAALARPDLIDELASVFGSQCVVLAVDAKARAAAYTDLQKTMHDEAPWVFLWQQHDLYGVANQVEWTPRADEKVWMYEAKVVAR